jgi:hypothetical protein
VKEKNHPRIGRLEALLARILRRSAEPRAATNGGSHWPVPDVSEEEEQVLTSSDVVEISESSTDVQYVAEPSAYDLVDEHDIHADDDDGRPSGPALLAAESRARLMDGVSFDGPDTTADEPPNSSRRPIAEPLEPLEVAPTEDAFPTDRLTPPPESGRQVASSTVQPVAPLDSGNTFRIDSREPTLVSEAPGPMAPPRATAKLVQATQVGVAAGHLPRVQPESFGAFLEATLSL